MNPGKLSSRWVTRNGGPWCAGKACLRRVRAVDLFEVSDKAGELFTRQIVASRIETTFLIDFERERRNNMGPTIEFLKANTDSPLLITHTIAGELACRASLSTANRWRSFCQPFLLLEWRPEVDWRYGQMHRYLKGQGRLIGVNDLWIAATALVYGHPVVTANKEHFRRVPELEVLSYRE